VTTGSKQAYLAVYDYGMGGVWVLIDARNPDEIESAYPELKVIHDRPSWLDAEQWRQIDRDAHFDIDAEPTGYLAALIEERESDAGT
jgi:hypothetical protein